MKHHHLGNSGVAIFPAVFGTSRLGGTVAHYDKQESLRILDEVLDSPVNCVDTADLYAQGNSEKLIGEATRKKRDKVVLATKGGYVLSGKAKLLSKLKPIVRKFLPARPAMKKAVGSFRGAQTNQCFTGGYLRKSLEASLRRLQTDYLDIYQLHSPDTETLRKGEVFETLKAFQKEGKIRTYGVSILSWNDVSSCVEGEATFVQVEADLIGEGAERARMIRETAERGTSLIARQAFGSGLLARSPQDWTVDDFHGDEARLGRARERVETLKKIGDPFDEVMNFLLLGSTFPAFLFATTNRGHLANNLAALRAALNDPGDFAELKQLFSPFAKD
ncbi:MAG: aldo/keto reductase, partial [Akkermansiaceae bacterium]